MRVSIVGDSGNARGHLPDVHLSLRASVLIENRLLRGGGCGRATRGTPIS